MKRLLLAVTLLMLCCKGAMAVPVPPLEALEQLRASFAAMQDFTAEISQEKQLAVMKRKLITSGTVRFKKPDLFFMEISPPYATRMLLRDTVMEQTSGREGEMNRILLPADQGLKHWFTKLTAPLTTLPEGVVIQADLTNGMYTLGIAPQGKGQIRELSITFQEDGTIRRLVITEQNGDRATMTFKKVRRNTGLSEKDFRLDQ